MNQALSVTLKLVGLSKVNEAVGDVNGLKTGLSKAGVAATIAGAAIVSAAVATKKLLTETIKVGESLKDMSQGMKDAIGSGNVTALSTMNQSVERMKATWESIKIMIASTIAPIVEKLMNWITKQLMKFANWWNGLSWTKNKIDVSGLVEETMKMNSAMKDTAKATKELKRALAGFDELDRLETAIAASTGIIEKVKTGSTGGGSTGGGGTGGSGGSDTSFIQEVADWLFEDTPASWVSGKTHANKDNIKDLIDWDAVSDLKGRELLDEPQRSNGKSIGGGGGGTADQPIVITSTINVNNDAIARVNKKATMVALAAV